MRCGEIPVGISLSHADKRTVTHIYRNKNFFAFPSRYRAFSQNHVVGVNVVVDSGELFCNVEFHARDNFVNHGFSVEHGEFLDYFHIVNVIFKKLIFHVSQMFRHICMFRVSEFCQFFLNLLFPALRFKSRNKLINFLLGGLIENFIRLKLIVFSNLQAEMT